MTLFDKKVPPPPREPGTHTNAEVKEALKARALRRTILITAVVILLFASLAVVSSIAQEYEGEEDSTSSPKLIWVVATELTPTIVERAIISNKAPFTRILNLTGGTYGRLSAKYEVGGSPLVKLLTGSRVTDKTTLKGSTSVLRELKAEGYNPVVVAPENFFSGVTEQSSGVCAQVGILDSECLGTKCATGVAADYCNAYRKYISCDNKAQLYRGEIVDGFEKVINDDADILYFHMQSFNEDGASANMSQVARKVQLRSEMNLVDNAIGTIALALAERTRRLKENWLIVFTCEGLNAEKEAPLLMAVYSRGELVQLNALQSGRFTSDLRGTLLKWFGITPSDVDASRYIGICSDGINVKNCRPA